MLTKEQIATLLSIKTLQSGSYGDKLREYQERIDERGRLQKGVSEDDAVVTYKNDLFANPEDIQNILSGQITENDLEQLTSGMGAQNTIQTLIDNNLIQPPDNVSQFLNFESGSQGIDPVRIHEILSTKIYELLPDQISRQLQIDQFVRLFSSIIPPELPPYCTHSDLPDVLPPDTIILDITGECNDGLKYEDWLIKYDISFIQDAGYPDDGSYLTRIQGNVNELGLGENQANEYGDGNYNKSIQYLRDVLSGYLKDIDFGPPSEILDSRPEYQFTSQGYLEIRNMNQAVVVKKGEGDDVGVGKMITLESGVMPPGYDLIGEDIWADTLGYDPEGFIDGMQIPEYLLKGFTLTQWIKFKDKVNGGTLINFGNPLLQTEPHGFRLETFTIGMDDYTNPDEDTFFIENDRERFVRLTVREKDLTIRDSNSGKTFSNGFTMDRVNTFSDGNLDNVNPFQYTRLPKVMDEWYFIVATYDPTIDEEEALGYTTYINDEYYWLGNKETDGTVVAKSGFGSRCKVEIISQTDLLRARGFKPIEDS
tara:strand:+ start:8587 stop:10200 length:1614 start_codon:yes stop_codon:yes gene_type:complete